MSAAWVEGSDKFSKATYIPSSLPWVRFGLLRYKPGFFDAKMLSYWHRLYSPIPRVPWDISSVDVESPNVKRWSVRCQGALSQPLLKNWVRASIREFYRSSLTIARVNNRLISNIPIGSSLTKQTTG